MYSTPYPLLAITPLERPDITLARAFQRHGATIAVDIGRDVARHGEIIKELGRLCAAAHGGPIGVRVPDEVQILPGQLPRGVRFLVTEDPQLAARWRGHLPVIAQVVSEGEARAALAAGALALIAKGEEAGGRVGEGGAFVLLQRILAMPETRDIDVWCQGGMGLHTAAAAIVGGARGVVLDSQLALLQESTLPEPIKKAVAEMDGAETRVLGGYRVYDRPGTAASANRELESEAVRSLLASDSLQQLLPMGQDAALARTVAAQYPTVEALLHGLLSRMAGHVRQAKQLSPLSEGSPLARAHGTRFPIAQGPMTRVSDTAEFAIAVAQNGALPFLALSVMGPDRARSLLERTRAGMATHGWGVGVLGFAPPEILAPHLELIREFRPSVVLLAGGRPSQARSLLELGIPTYLHVPSPALLDLFLKDGARHFVFEGRECGGHVGPRYSFVLWEQQIERLLAFDRPEELHLYFAGGIHDARSAAMVATLAAPLAARGAKVGVLMGTAYVATEEAVRTGAIVQEFQGQILAASGTTLIETGPGHAVRCLETPFVEAFDLERRRLQEQALSPQEVWKALEEFNVGRLRMASKGVTRSGSALTPIELDAQRREGMYMIGQAATLCGDVRTIMQLHTAVSVDSAALIDSCVPPAMPRSPLNEPVAIIGMECIFPGSPDAESFWANILQGRDLVTEVPRVRWNPDIYYDDSAATPKGKTPSKWGGFVSEVAFDPLQYGIPPQALASIEPAQLLSLEVAHRALADAGYGGGRYFDRERTSVIFGAEAGMELSNAYAFRNSFSQYCGELPEQLDAVLPSLTEDSFPGVLANVIAGRIANRLGLGGVNYSVDAACASSLAAVDLAVKELRSGSSDLVLAGGADFHNSINDFLMFASVKALSRSGRCRPFSADADGICLGEGAAVIVLKRLSDAQRDGDRIYAVIEAVAGSSDGKGLGLTAPRKEGQKRALERAYWQAGQLPAAVGLVEAHGTGTVVGDRTELQTLTEVYNAGGGLPGQTALGSVKSQIGHTKCAAGLAGVIKVAKALYHRVLPPTQHIDTPIEWYRPAGSPFVFDKAPRIWQDQNARAAVSAFGFGGTNFHVVLHGNASHASDTLRTGSEWPEELFVFRGRDPAAGLLGMRMLRSFLQQSTARLRLSDLSFTMSQSGSGPVQCAFVATDLEDLDAKLQLALDATDAPDIQRRAPGDAGKVAFLFPGQGSQAPGMLQGIFLAFPHLRPFLQHAQTLLGTLYPPTAYDTDEERVQRAALTDTRIAQPALGVVEFAMATLLQGMGVCPELLGGHSYGELVALAVAGTFDFPTLLRVSRERGEAMIAAAGADPGMMAAVGGPGAEVAAAVREIDGVVLANQNSPTQTVISGPSSAMTAALAALKQRGLAARILDVAAAFHSPVIGRAEQLYADCLSTAEISMPRLPVYSNTTAETYPSRQAALRARLAEHIVKPVRFVEQIERMYADGARTFVEVGPGRALTGFVESILAGRPHHAVATDRKGRSGILPFLEALAQLAVLTEGVDLQPLYSQRQVRQLDLAQPAQLGAATWLVNGHRARPLHGELPAHAGRPVAVPIELVVNSPRTDPERRNVPQEISQETVVLNFLGNVREMVAAQREVMLGLLGRSLPTVRSELPRGQPAAIEARRDFAAPVVEPLTAPAAITAAPATGESAGLQDTLLTIVSARTGYPREMLDLDLDLEADLSIDSIKRMEIVGELAQSRAAGQSAGARDVTVEDLAGLKTLRALLDRLESSALGSGAPAAPAESGGASGGSNAEALPTPAPLSGSVERFRLRSVQIEMPELGPAGLVGKRFLITDDGRGIASRLAERLESYGAPTRIMPLTAELASEGLDLVNGLIHLGSLHPDHRGHDVIRFYDVVRSTLLHNHLTYLVAATGLSGQYGHYSGESPISDHHQRGGGLGGLLKSVAKECPDIHARCIDLDLRDAPEELARYLELEILAKDRLLEVGYRHASRFRMDIQSAALPRQGEQAALHLDGESVVLLTGGARGITAAVAQALAARYHCHIELVGRTSFDPVAEAPEYASAADASALRRLILAENPGIAPAAVEKRCSEILAGREIHKSLAAIRHAGARVRYTSLDVRDPDAFGQFIEDLYRHHGRIDGVIHGAGIVEDKLVRHKDEASFKRVFDTKVLGAATLCASLREDVKFVVFFSSVASAFGNRGQADYAAANDVLDKLAYTLQARLSGRVVSINWGPWSGRGMVSAELEREYARRGIGLIPLRQGVEALLQELQYGRREDVQVVIMHTGLAGTELAAQRSAQALG